MDSKTHAKLMDVGEETMRLKYDKKFNQNYGKIVDAYNQQFKRYIDYLKGDTSDKIMTRVIAMGNFRHPNYLLLADSEKPQYVLTNIEGPIVARTFYSDLKNRFHTGMDLHNAFKNLKDSKCPIPNKDNLYLEYYSDSVVPFMQRHRIVYYINGKPKPKNCIKTCVIC